MDTPKIWMQPPPDIQTGERGDAKQIDATHDEIVKHMVAGWSQLPVDEKGELTEAGRAMLPKGVTAVAAAPQIKQNSPVIPATGA